MLSCGMRAPRALKNASWPGGKRSLSMRAVSAAMAGRAGRVGLVVALLCLGSWASGGFGVFLSWDGSFCGSMGDGDGDADLRPSLMSSTCSTSIEREKDSMSWSRASLVSDGGSIVEIMCCYVSSGSTMHPESTPSILFIDGMSLGIANRDLEILRSLWKRNSDDKTA